MRTSRLERALGCVREALSERDAAAFVHSSGELRTLFGVDSVVVTPEEAVGLVERDRIGVPDAVDCRTVDDPAVAVEPVVTELVDADGSGTVLAPRAVRHDTALVVERAGFEVASTEVLAEARLLKTPAEQDALRALGDGITAGVERVETLLAEATADGVERDDAVTATSLRRAVAVELARRDIDAADTSVETGAHAATAPLQVGEPVVVECRPRSRDGSRLRAAWTVVVDGDGGWERRAHVAQKAAHRVGRERLAAVCDGEEETPGSVAAEVQAELTAFGFESPSVEVHGIGSADREPPEGGQPLERGQAVMVAASVRDVPDAQPVVRAESYLLGQEPERLVALPTSLSV